MWKFDQWLEATFGMSTIIEGYPNPIYMLLLGVPCFLLLLFLMIWVENITSKRKHKEIGQ